MHFTGQYDVTVNMMIKLAPIHIEISIKVSYTCTMLNLFTFNSFICTISFPLFPVLVSHHDL